MTATASKRKTTPPRKAAKRISTNGSSPTEAVNGSAPAPEPEIRPPEEFVPTTTPVVDSAPSAPAAPPVPPHPYGDRQVYVFQPSNASEPPIVFPDIRGVQPTYHFMWKLRKLDQVQQSFEWMDLAGVPDPIQERVATLPDADQGRFFLGWFSPAIPPVQGAGPPGES